MKLLFLIISASQKSLLITKLKELFKLVYTQTRKSTQKIFIETEVAWKRFGEVKGEQTLEGAL